MAWRSLCSFLCILTSCLLLSACGAKRQADTPYQRPELPSKAEWSKTATVQVSASETIRPKWWNGFQDPYLSQLLERAITDNLDLRILAARVESARASLGAEQAGALPKVSAEITPQVQQTRQGRTEQYSAQASSNWELDVWGRVRKGILAKKAEFKATEADWRAGYLTLASEVATKYFDIRQLDEQMTQQQRALDNNARILGIYRQQFEEGLIANTQVLQQEAELNNLKQQLLDQQRQRQILENELATLLGRPAGEFQVPVASLTHSAQPLEVPPRLPADLLSRRPDIIAQEYRVLQAHHAVGQAHLAKLPSFSMTGNGGVASTLLSQLLKTWTLGLALPISIPVFDPSLEASVRSSEASAQIAKEEYRKTVLKAFEEVENALTNLASHKRQKQEIEAQLARLERVQQQIHRKLRAGLASQLEVFESERTLLAAQQNRLAIHKQILTDTVTLYKVLGGGWPPERIQ